jgi:hypothetical protein
MSPRKYIKKCPCRTYRNGPQMAVTTVRAEKDKMLFLKNKGFTYSYIFALGMEKLIETGEAAPSQNKGGL